MPPLSTDKYFWKERARKELSEQLKKAPIVRKAKNVIFFLGDGMSISTLTAARIYRGQSTSEGERQVMEWEKFPYSTLIKVLIYT